MKKSNILLMFMLALGVFGIITTEMGIVGVLPQITEKFNITASQAGMLVSIFALIVAVSGPFLTLIFSRFNRKIVLLTAIFMFVLSNIFYAYTASFQVMLIFRILPAMFHPVFFSVALVTAAGLVVPEKSNAAIAKVFAGITVGFAFGVPLTSFLAEQFSLESAFLFGAAVNAIAFIGMLIWLPSLPIKEKLSYGKQLGILRKPGLWINIGAIMFIFAAMFSVYSYFAEYLSEVTNMNKSLISVMLMAFGCIMIYGNFLFGGFLQKNMTKTVILFPVLYTVIYVVAYLAGSFLLPMILAVCIWGIIHSGGLIVSQNWLMAEADEAPEFGNSLFVSFSNLGITIGASVGGWFIAQFGIHQLIWSGVIFAIIAFMLIMLKTKMLNRSKEKIKPVPSQVLE
ncbi:MFS transporter [Bacillus sp. 1P06AnD]|uniref:MFS transporter n=1 Tax=Bacillus sp. 1P06AnD TaxID=3132208 RepID=UPI0039A1ED59